jgi:ubiquitin-protein ligase
LNNASRWKQGTTLVDVIKVIVKYLNEPDPDYAVNFEMGKEYVENREEYNRKAFAKAKASCPP